MWTWLSNHWNQIFEVARAIIEICVLWVVFYQLYRAFQATRGAKILTGLVFLFICISLMTYLFELTVIAWIITRVAGPFMAVGLVVIFQPELRMGLAKLGTSRLFSFINKSNRIGFLEEFCKAVGQLSKKHWGALFAFERTISLDHLNATGVKLDAKFSPELVHSIFSPRTALHDGGIVIGSDRIIAAACVFPASQKELKDRTLGLRHRAALGLSEESDAVVVVVSEETGIISLAMAGTLERNLTLEELMDKLKHALRIENEKNEKADNA